MHALAAAGITKVFADKRSGATRDRPGLHAALDHARAGDVIVVHTLDRLGRTVRDTLNLMHELKERAVGVRTLADPLRIDTSDPESPMAQLAVVMLALFAEMERTYAAERTAHARAVATANGRRTGRPSVVDAAKLEHALMLRDKGAPMREIVTKTGLAHHPVSAPAASLPRQHGRVNQSAKTWSIMPGRGRGPIGLSHQARACCAVNELKTRLRPRVFVQRGALIGAVRGP